MIIVRPNPTLFFFFPDNQCKSFLACWKSSLAGRKVGFGSTLCPYCPTSTRSDSTRLNPIPVSWLLKLFHKLHLQSLTTEHVFTNVGFYFIWYRMLYPCLLSKHDVKCQRILLLSNSLETISEQINITW